MNYLKIKDIGELLCLVDKYTHAVQQTFKSFYYIKNGFCACKAIKYCI